ncbi:tol-pal system protein YbgF [Roseovarius albus]|uniref:Cell division coordinator CpoB n=1 Tax=Roseovarius albus TaxID=1247867 RepID=A0A1X6YFG8_9RHOB|nr:tol-pal system protein YbgF [Roseovarius albus]SLN19910.1 tol-pal system protein YbgF [Roseovarius albus]
MRFLFPVIVGLVLTAPVGVLAQSQDETLADIRQELSVLYVEIQKLKRELSTTGASGQLTGGGSLIDRVNAIESELQRLTSKTEELEHKVVRVAQDGGNRIGDLEFRLCELEAKCDIGSLEPGSTLGGVTAGNDTGGGVVTPLPSVEGEEEVELAIGERADFETAQAALESGSYAAAAEQFANFQTNYPGSPLSGQAGLLRGQALDGAGDKTGAARSYLDTFSAAPNGPQAPDALYLLGNSLGQLGQTDEACVTLGEVGVRFPGSEAEGKARAALSELGCQ